MTIAMGDDNAARCVRLIQKAGKHFVLALFFPENILQANVIWAWNIKV
jgi:hypothetical protein